MVSEHSMTGKRTVIPTLGGSSSHERIGAVKEQIGLVRTEVQRDFEQMRGESHAMMERFEKWMDRPEEGERSV